MVITPTSKRRKKGGKKEEYVPEVEHTYPKLVTGPHLAREFGKWRVASRDERCAKPQIRPPIIIGEREASLTKTESLPHSLKMIVSLV